MDDEWENRAQCQLPSKSLSQGRLFVISLYWLCRMALWASVYFILLPAQSVLALGVTDEATHLSLVVMGGGIVNLVASPLIGALSDRIMITKYVSSFHDVLTFADFGVSFSLCVEALVLLPV